MSKQILTDGILTVGSQSWGFIEVAFLGNQIKNDTGDTGENNSSTPGRIVGQFSAKIITDEDHPIGISDSQQSISLIFGLREYSGLGFILQVRLSGEIDNRLIWEVFGRFNGTASNTGVDITLIPASSYAVAKSIPPGVNLPDLNVQAGAINAIGRKVDPTILINQTTILPGSIYAIARKVDPTVVISGAFPSISIDFREYSPTFATDGTGWMRLPLVSAATFNSTDWTIEFDFYFPTYEEYPTVVPKRSIINAGYSLDTGYPNLDIGVVNGDEKFVYLQARVGVDAILQSYGIRRGEWNHVKLIKQSDYCHLETEWQYGEYLITPNNESAGTAWDNLTTIDTIILFANSNGYTSPPATTRIPPGCKIRNLVTPWWEFGTAYFDTGKTTEAEEGEDVAVIENAGAIGGDIIQTSASARPILEIKTDSIEVPNALVRNKQLEPIRPDRNLDPAVSDFSSTYGYYWRWLSFRVQTNFGEVYFGPGITQNPYLDFIGAREGVYKGCQLNITFNYESAAYIYIDVYQVNKSGSETLISHTELSGSGSFDTTYTSTIDNMSHFKLLWNGTSQASTYIKITNLLMEIIEP